MAVRAATHVAETDSESDSVTPGFTKYLQSFPQTCVELVKRRNSVKTKH